VSAYPDCPGKKAVKVQHVMLLIKLISKFRNDILHALG